VREELIPIDHGFCLPEALESPYLEWLFWPQACAHTGPPSHLLACMRLAVLVQAPRLHGHGRWHALWGTHIGNKAACWLECWGRLTAEQLNQCTYMCGGRRFGLTLMRCACWAGHDPLRRGRAGLHSAAGRGC
jgi:hypothetical protein